MSADQTTTTSDMTAAASQLLAALNPDERAAVWWPIDDPERRRWFYTPTDHGGLSLAEMTSAQHRLVWRLLATGLSEGGYVTASAIVGHENVLDYVENFSVDYRRERGRDPMLYWVAIFGEPSETGTWSWRFGGHHISLHFTVIDGRVVSTTPCFFGADPANSPLLGPHLLRPLAGAEDFGRALAQSLDPTQAGRAIVSTVPPVDLIGSNRTTLSEGDLDLSLADIWRGRFEENIHQRLVQMQGAAEKKLGVTPERMAPLAFSRTPSGLGAVDLTDQQRELLRRLLGVYVGRVRDDLADEQLALFHGDLLDELHFVWAGSLTAGEPHYYRIQGADLFIEYDNTARDGNHLHAVWRDLRHDFGGDPLADHHTAIDHTAIDHTAIDHTAINQTAVDAGHDHGG